MDREVVGGQETARAVAGDRSFIGRSWGTGAGQGSRRGQELDRGEVVGDRSRPGQSQGTRVG